MEVAAKSNSKPMYSWWWDSHNTPKNSKWLQENLADMDSNVKKMIKVLEEDADSFARRAEMYYRKRPELMQLVEEFYRAYRALAERYNHATGVIHKAHETIAEAFPSQVPLIFGDESSHVDPQTPDLHLPFRARFDQDEIKRNIDFSEEAQFVSNGKARKGLNFNDEDGKGRNDLKSSERASKAEAEVMALKDSISKMEVEKEASLAQFEKNLEKLSNLEAEMTRVQEESRGFNYRAVIAEAEIQTLRENLEKLESDYQKCLQKIAEAGEIANKAESETLFFKESLTKAEERLKKAEEDSRLINERAEKSGVEVENLKQTISKLIEDKEASELQYQQCLDIIAELKLKLYNAQEETQRLNSEIEDGVAKLKFSEEKCLVLERSNQNLHSELDSLLEKLGNQNEKLTEKQTEVVKLWSSVQEEHLRFQEAETAFQTLQQLHSQSQEELNNLGLELETRSWIMKDIEIRHNELEEEIQQAKGENKELNVHVSSLKETIQKLEVEVELRVDQRNALQQEIYFLKEELNQVKKRHESMVESVGSSVKSLQEYNEREKSEKMALFEKLETMEKLIQKNFLLEKSITDLNFELEAIREKLKTLEKEACESVTANKSSLAIENIVLVESLRELNSEAIGIATEKKFLEEELKEIKAEKEKLNQETLWESQAATFLISTVHETLMTHELAEACKNLESKDLDIEEKLKRRNQANVVLLNESIKSLEDYVFTHRKSKDKVTDSETEDGIVKLEDMCLRIKAVSEAIIEKEKFLMLENSNAYTMLEEALKQIKELKLGASGRRSIRKVQQEGGGGSGKTRKPSHHEIEMVTKDIVLDQTSDGSSYEIISKRRDLELDYNHSFVELKPVKTHAKGKSVSEESLVIDKLEIFDGFMDPNREINNKRKVLERLDSDLRKLENLQITVDDLKSKVGGTEKKVVEGDDEEYETIKGQLQEAEEAVEKLFNVNRKLTTKAESYEKEVSSDRRRKILEQARRGSEKIGRLQLELQRIQFLLVKLDGEKKKEKRERVKISDDSKSKVLLRDYIYGGGTRSVSMKKTTMKKKRSAFCGCVQQPRSP